MQNSPSPDKPWNNIRTFEDYSEQALATAVYPRSIRLLRQNGEDVALYPFGKLGGETGEMLEKVFKAVRDADGIIDDERREAIMHELGDILWYVNACARELGYSLGTVARRNIGKLAGRKERNTLQGDGDAR